MNRITRLLVLCLYIFWGPLSAAAPITHAYLSYRFFDYIPKYTNEQQQAFLNGTLFPDIRYLGDATRSQTHYNAMSFVEVLTESSPFMAGVKFHSYVDIVRENFVRNYGVYHYLSNFPKDHLYTLVKLLEDQILFKKGNWEPVLAVIKEVRPEELLWGFSKEKVELWHNMLRTVFMNPPANILSLLALSHKGLLDVSPEETAIWNQSFQSLVEDPYIQNYVLQLTQLFDKLFYTAELQLQNKRD